MQIKKKLSNKKTMIAIGFLLSYPDRKINYISEQYSHTLSSFLELLALTISNINMGMPLSTLLQMLLTSSTSSFSFWFLPLLLLAVPQSEYTLLQLQVQSVSQLRRSTCKCGNLLASDNLANYRL